MSYSIPKLRSFCTIFFLFKLETDIVWPSWTRYSTKDLETTEMQEYMRKVFTKKYRESPDDLVGWSFFGRQGIESSYVKIKIMFNSK